MLASVAEQASLSLTWSETPEDMFSPGVAHFYPITIKLENNYRSTGTKSLTSSKFGLIGLSV